MTCQCGNSGWLCEKHPGQAFGHDDCAGPGEPCPVCNAQVLKDQVPRLPPGFEVEVEWMPDHVVPPVKDNVVPFRGSIRGRK